MLLKASPTAETILSSKSATWPRWLASCSTRERSNRHMDATARNTTSRYGSIPGTESLTMLVSRASLALSAILTHRGATDRPAYGIPLRVRFVKRAIDIVVASIGLLAVAVLFPLLMLAIRLDSPGPVFYRQ